MSNFCRKIFSLSFQKSNSTAFARHLGCLKVPLKFKTNSSVPQFLRFSVAPTSRSFHGSVCFQNANSETKAAESKDEISDTLYEEHQELDAKVVKYAELVTDIEVKKKILMILMEHEVAKLEGKKVPQKINVDDMRELLSLYSFSARVKYLAFLFEKELRKSADKRKREIKKKEREAWLIEKESLKPADHIQYGIGHNTLIIRVRRKSVMHIYNQHLAMAVLFGQKFVIDMDYDCFMRKQDCNNCGEQLLELYGVNRKNRYPYDLYFCNADHNGATVTAFNDYMPNLYAPDNFATITDQNYLDLFPKDRLVYITPYAKEPLKTYDHNAVYILGGLVDKCVREPVTLAKAKREGIRAVHLPYDEYLMWGRGNKSLPLNQVLEILLEMKRTCDWNKAFRYVPQRKLVRSLDLFSEF